MMQLGKISIVLGVIFTLALTACNEKRSSSGGFGLEEEVVVEEVDTDGDGVADIDDVFPEDPNFASLAISATANDLASKVRSVSGTIQELGGEGKVVKKADALEIGRCNESSFSKLDDTLSKTEVPVMYVDWVRLEQACPDRARGKPFQCNTVALLEQKTVTDFRLDITVASNPDDSWAILFRSDGLKGYHFAYDVWAHRWATWSGGEVWPFGIYNLYSITGMKEDGLTTDSKNIVSKAFQSKPTKAVQQITIVAIGPKITIYEGDQLLFAVEDSTFQSGKIGFRTWLGSCMKVQNLSIAEKLERLEPPAE